MGFTKTEAIVLRTKNLREADKLITLYTKEYGKMQAVAKGLGKIKTGYGASLEIFSHNQVMLFAKTEKDMAKITGCKILHPFYSLRESFFKYSMASYLLELVDQLSEYHQANDEIFNLLGKSFSLMEKGVLKNRQNYLLLWEWFAAKLLTLSGYKLSLEFCVFCRQRASEKKQMHISFSAGGLVCSNCFSEHQNTYQIKPEVLSGLNLLQKCELMKLSTIDLDVEIRLQLKKYLEEYYNYLLGYELNCQKFSNKYKYWSA